MCTLHRVATCSQSLGYSEYFIEDLGGHLPCPRSHPTHMNLLVNPKMEEAGSSKLRNNGKYQPACMVSHARLQQCSENTPN
jgi:hypothetical protein